MIKIFSKTKTPDLSKHLKEVVDKVTDDIFDQVKDRTPVDTGFAKASWKTKKGGSRNRVSNPANYSSFLDEGRSSQAPQGMTKPAINIIKEFAKQGRYKRR